MDIENLKNIADKFALDRDWDQFHSVKNLAMALSVESSELVEIFQWMTEEQSNNVKNKPELLEKAADEVADVFVYLMRLSGKLNINLETAVLKKMEKNEKKYPIELARGNAKKYTEF